MTVLVNIVFDGVAYAMLLFMISVGLSVTMGLMGFINLAHGAFAMVGGYVMVALTNSAGVPFIAALGLAFIAVALASMPLERVLYRPLYGASELDQVLLSIGLVFATIGLITLVFGPQPPSLQIPDALGGRIDLGFGRFPTYRVFTIAVGFATMAALWWGLERTVVGARIRAAVDNRRMARSVGIDVDGLFVRTFAIGSGLAAIGGGLAVEIVGISPRFAFNYLIFFLVVVAVGGLGSVRGAFFAALILGIVDTAGKYYWPQSGAFVIYFVAVLILLVRPQGLFGRA